MRIKKCIKPNCGLVFNEREEEFKEGYCECGCTLELVLDIPETAMDEENPKAQQRSGEIVAISDDGTLIFSNDEAQISKPISSNDEVKTSKPKAANMYLDIYCNGQVYKTFCIKYDEIIIGRSCIDNTPDLDLSSIDLEKKISRRHAMVYRIQNEYYIKNLSTKNSLHVNGDPVLFNNVVKIEADTEIVLSNFIGLYFYEDDWESGSNE